MHELMMERRIAARPATVWRVFTERTAEWWCPKPWTTPVVDWDLRAGGTARCVMQSPEGERHEHPGIFLEVVPERRVVFTDAFGPGWLPLEPFMVATMALEPDGDGTLYRASCRHWTEAALQQHVAMGFEGGWGAVAAQLAALAEAEENAHGK
jgi:uncharacterized protein YndB with AHSA1/START domain